MTGLLFFTAAATLLLYLTVNGLAITSRHRHSLYSLFQ